MSPRCGAERGRGGTVPHSPHVGDPRPGSAGVQSAGQWTPSSMRHARERLQFDSSGDDDEPQREMFRRHGTGDRGRRRVAAGAMLR
eukprot:gene41866-4949_t